MLIKVMDHQSRNNNIIDQLREESFFLLHLDNAFGKNIELPFNFICYFNLIYLSYFDFHKKKEITGICNCNALQMC